MSDDHHKHHIVDDLSDEEGINRQRRKVHVEANTLVNLACAPLMWVALS